MKFFKGRTVLVASMHGKEAVIAPLLEKELGLKCITNTEFNTDLFGTFSGEIERTLSPLETLRNKCLVGMESLQCDLGIATEGSFGPHPFLHIVPAHEEIILLIDSKNKLEIIAKTMVTETNFLGREIFSEQDMIEFMDAVQFPSHGIILKDKASNFQVVYKDAESSDELLFHFHSYQQKFGSVHVETDMRAMRNPTRMKIIEKVCQELIYKIENTCPSCQTPGFDVIDCITGLPCSLCQMPTSSILANLFACQKCQFVQQMKRKDGREFEEPTYCSFCNP
jgi:hypothetical protein